MSSIISSAYDSTNGAVWASHYNTGTQGVIGAITSAWNSAAFDYATNTMHVVCSGGHGDSWNNQCYSLQVPSGSWSRTKDQTTWPPDAHTVGVYEPVDRYTGVPTNGDGFDASGAPNPAVPWLGPVGGSGVHIYKDFAPCSRHIYGGSLWLPNQQRVMLMSGACFPEGSSDFYVGFFNPSTGVWTRKNNANISGPGINLLWDSVRNKVVYSFGTSNVYTYDPATDTAATKIGCTGTDPGASGQNWRMCLDGTCTYVYAVITGGWLAIKPSLGSAYDNAILRMKLGQAGLQAWEPVKVYGDTTAMYALPPGFEYDPDLNAFVFWAAEDPTNVSILRLSDFRINRVPIKGTMPDPTPLAPNHSTKGVWGRFRRYGKHQYCLMTSPTNVVSLITLA